MAKSHLRFDELAPSASGKTRRWRVGAASGNDYIGSVAWFSPWRRYTFAASHGVFDAACLREIADFCESRTLEHKAAA